MSGVSIGSSPTGASSCQPAHDQVGRRVRSHHARPGQSGHRRRTLHRPFRSPANGNHRKPTESVVCRACGGRSVDSRWTARGEGRGQTGLRALNRLHAHAAPDQDFRRRRIDRLSDQSLLRRVQEDGVIRSHPRTPEGQTLHPCALRLLDGPNALDCPPAKALHRYRQPLP